MKKIILSFSLLAMLLGVACTTSKNNTSGVQSTAAQTAATPTATPSENGETKQTSLKKMPAAEHKALPSKSAKQQVEVGSPTPLPTTSKY